MEGGGGGLFHALRPILGPRCSAPAGASPIRGLRRVAIAPRRARPTISCTSARPWAKVQRPGRSKSDPGLAARGYRAAPGPPYDFLHLGPSMGQGAAPRPKQVRSGACGAWLSRRAGLAVLASLSVEHGVAGAHGPSHPAPYIHLGRPWANVAHCSNPPRD